MSRYTALLDANVLYPAPMRDILMQLAVTDLFKARWTDDIHHEWIEALLRQQPERSREKLERTRDLMNQSARDSLIYGYEAIIPCLELPDTDDRHVLAARCYLGASPALPLHSPGAEEAFINLDNTKKRTLSFAMNNNVFA